MKIISKNISTKDGAGKIKLRAEDSEDMWHAYNLIVAGDLVRTVTMRKVVKEGVTGSTASKKIKINFTTQDSNKELIKLNQYCPKARDINQNKMRANDNINPIPVIL